ncbi:MAG: glycosyltransferase [Oscillospiraceae bacterium]|nr:glycosyltransferase [Oscillospiraceae bacterium]
MNKLELVSVIVPIYRVEKYIESCIESIMNQTYRELQIILVDDESPDRCGEICDRYAAMDPRILVLHRKNGGAAAARNAGLRAATGAYIAFVDSDDYLEPDAYEHMVRTLEDSGADIVQAGFRNVYVNAAQVHPGETAPREYSTAAYLTHFTEDWTCALCWDKLFRQHVLKDVFFEEGHLIDDEYFTYKGALNARKIVYIPTVTYNHRVRASSVMQHPAGLERKNRDALDAVAQRYTDVTARFPELTAHYNHHYADYLLYYATSDRATINTIREIKKRLLAHVLHGRALPWKDGQRKLFLRILVFLPEPVGSIIKKRKERTQNREYELFE